MKTQIEFTRVNNDTNGNPRYVCHFFNLLTDAEVNQDNRAFSSKIGLLERYNLAVKRANKIGGRKFNNRQYGGGIVFEAADAEAIEKKILNLLNN